MTISVSGPPHSTSRTSATMSAVASPTTNGTSVKSGAPAAGTAAGLPANARRRGRARSRSTCGSRCAMASRLRVDGDDAERRGECARARQRQSANGHAVRGPQQDHAANDGGDGPQPRVRGRRDRPRVDVPGVRDDQRLRGVTGRAGRPGDVGQQAIDRGPQRGGFGRVESPGHGGSAKVHALARITTTYSGYGGLGRGLQAGRRAATRASQLTFT